MARGSVSAQAFVLTQSSAILFYADAEAPGRILPPQADRTRIRALEALFYFTSDVIALNGAAFSLRGPEFSGAAATLTERYVAAIAGSERFLFMGGASFSIAAFTIISAVTRHFPRSQLRRSATWHGSDRPSTRRPNRDEGVR